jgi:hypothetical protein
LQAAEASAPARLDGIPWDHRGVAGFGDEVAWRCTMPGHDEQDVRRSRQDASHEGNEGDDRTFEGGLAETGSSGEDGDFVGAVTNESGEFSAEHEVGGTGRLGDVGAGGAGGGTTQRSDATGEQFGESGVGGIGGTGMTDPEHGSEAQSSLTTGIGAAGDQTDEELLEDR